MKTTIINFLAKTFGFIYNEIVGKKEEKYVEIRFSSPVEVKREVVPFALYDRLPAAMENKDALVRKAETLYKDDEARLKWLIAIHKLHASDTEWIMQPMSSREFREHNQQKNKQFRKWGLTSLGGA